MEASLSRMSKEERRERKRHVRDAKAVPRDTLFPDEEIVIAATPARFASLPKYVLTLGLYEMWRRRNTAVVTDQRILFGSGIFDRNEQSIPLRNVMDVVFRRRGLNSYAEVAVTKRGKSSVTTVGPMTGSAARRLVTEILRRT
jgi:hypothetical protein